MASGVIFKPRFISHGLPMEEKRKCAFFNSLSFLYAKAYSVLSKEIEAMLLIENICPNIGNPQKNSGAHIKQWRKGFVFKKKAYDKKETLEPH